MKFSFRWQRKIMGIKQDIGKKIKRMRQNRGLTQEKLAEIVDISQRTLSGIEIGENFATAETIDKIIKALDTTTDELFMLGHLKDKIDLIDEIKEMIDRLSKDKVKIEYIYKFLKSISNE